MNLWVILLVVFVVLILGGFLVWFLSARRPAKLDPMNELLIQDLIKLQRDHPARAADIIARALVRSRLVTRTDLERIGETPSLPKAEPSRGDQSRGRGRGDDQRARTRSEGDQRSSTQGGSQQQSSSRDQSGGQQSSSRSRRGGRGGGQQKPADQQPDMRREDAAKPTAPRASTRDVNSEKNVDGTEATKPKRRRRPRRRRKSSGGSDQANTSNQQQSGSDENRQTDNG